MTDLIERLNKHRCGDITRELIDEAMDALEAKDAEIERLNCALTISRGKHENAIAWNVKLQAVVDAAKLVCHPSKVFRPETSSVAALANALAALEDDDD